MSKNERFRKRYKTGDTPWDLGRPDANLVEIVTRRPINSCRVLELGCGTGTDTVWLAQQGFEATGTDVSGVAIGKAKERAAESGVECTFLELDFLHQPVPGGPFRFIYDRDCFHSFDTASQRKKFAKNAAAHLESGGMWLSFVGSADDPPRDSGPPMRSLKDVVLAVEPYFKILSVTASQFDSLREIPPGAWICLMTKREK